MKCLNCNVSMRVNPITKDVKEYDRTFFKNCLICRKHIAGYCRKCADQYLHINYIRVEWNAKLISKKKDHLKDQHTSVDIA